MSLYPITLNLPEHLYRRLQQTAQSMRQPLDEVLVRVVEKGSPPTWDDIPASYQIELAALDRLDDDALWQIARARQTDDDMARYGELLEKNASETLSTEERAELVALREAADLFMLKKAQAVALLHWRGYPIPPAEKL
jgi:hypothetical protein